MVTSDPKVFASALREIGNDNEILIWMKPAAVDPVSPEALLADLGDIDFVVGLSQRRARVRKNNLGLRIDPTALAQVRGVLGQFGIQPYRQPRFLPVYPVRVPDSKLVPVLAAILAHPNVDWVGANQVQVAHLPPEEPMPADDADPFRVSLFADRPPAVSIRQLDLSGSNPLDSKHYFHAVDEAWIYGKGGTAPGERVGVFGSGYAGPGGYHVDGQALGLGLGAGIHKLGFSDDYDNCENTGGQENGLCPDYDDHGSGTRDAGIVGENDNSIGYVGIMPAGTTVSMKITHNVNVAGAECQSADPNRPSTTYCFEEDDFVAAIEWAASEEAGISTVALPFYGTFDSDIRAALLAPSFHILFLAPTKDNQFLGRDPACWEDRVTGVASVTISGAGTGSFDYAEFSTYLRGQTTNVSSCPVSSFCSPGGYVNASGGGVSTVTAAGIAGLVWARANKFTVNPEDVVQTLVSTSHGPFNILDAYWAVLSIPPE